MEIDCPTALQKQSEGNFIRERLSASISPNIHPQLDTSFEPELADQIFAIHLANFGHPDQTRANKERDEQCQKLLLNCTPKLANFYMNEARERITALIAQGLSKEIQSEREIENQEKPFKKMKTK